MAIGDAGAAAGFEVTPSSQDLKLGYERLNKKADELAALKQQITALTASTAALIPPGTSITGYWNNAPAGYLLEQGQVYLRTTYPALFAAIGTIYNAANTPANSFKLPDSRGRVQALIGPAGIGDSRFTYLGTHAGAFAVELTAANNGLHNHSTNRQVIALSGAGIRTDSGIGGLQGNAIEGLENRLVDSSGFGQAHENVQPTIIVNRAIKY